MKRLALFIVFLGAFSGYAAYSDWFENKALRFDYFHMGNAVSEYYSLDELIQEPYWAGNKTNLIDMFGYGKYKVVVYDVASNTMIYSMHYATLFGEWQITNEATSIFKTFSETVLIPFPKKSVRLDFYSRSKRGIWEKKWEYSVDPKSYFIRQDSRFKFPTYDVQISGDAAQKVDIVVLPEGYTKEELGKFKADCDKFAKYLFGSSPYKENKSKFNIRAILAPSEESGPDVPGEGVWKRTILNSSFYTFDTERYLMTSDNKSVRDLAGIAPYDQIYIIVNTKIYGGGAIYNFYATTVADNFYGEYVTIHEFGHAFAGLGDEYYDSETSYNEMYPLDVEPNDPNLTTLVSFDKKWKDLVDKNTPVPTPADDQYKSKVGAFEGGGYVNKGVYRPTYDCTMKSISVNNFCPVCTRSIQQMIDFYCK